MEWRWMICASRDGGRVDSISMVFSILLLCYGFASRAQRKPDIAELIRNAELSMLNDGE